jgi:hypothetical protein
MFLQTVLTTRRQFLEHSLLGFGSALILPSLLASCTDHRVPISPSGPTIPIPSLGDYSIDWNDAAKTAVTTGLEMIPEVGDILGALVDIFWPSTNEDVWSEIKAQVEALVDQKIAANVYQQVSEDLQGLNNSLTLYLNELKNGNASSILDQWISTRTVFVNALPHFQSQGYELPLLPLFGQFANMYLALLRDGVIKGKDWGRTDADQQQTAQDCITSINGFYAYTANVYNTGRFNLMKATKRNDSVCEPFRTVNTYDRQMTLTVLDFMDSWYYYDAIKYPNGAKVVLGREIYSNPFGSCDYSTNKDTIGLPTPPTQFPTNLTVWSGPRITAAQLTYPANSGPGSVTQTPRMGDLSRGSANIVNTSPSNPITKVRTLTGVYQGQYFQNALPGALQFQFNDGTTTGLVGDTGGNLGALADSGLFGYPNEALSSVYIHGANTELGGADCVVFGFQYWQSPATTLVAIGTFYVKSPNEHSAADFAKAFPKLGITEGVFTDALKAARKAYWAYMETRAKALK